MASALGSFPEQKNARPLGKIRHRNKASESSYPPRRLLCPRCAERPPLHPHPPRTAPTLCIHRPRPANVECLRGGPWLPRGFLGSRVRSSQTSPGEAEEGHPSAAVSWQHRSREITVDPENMRELLSGETGDIQRTRWDKLRRVK